MIRHVFKLIWNRKRTNFLMMTEIFVSFLVLFAVVALGVYTADNWRRPLGFSNDRVWSVQVDMQQMSDDTFDEAQQESTRQLMLAVAEFPEIEKSAGRCWRRTNSARPTAATLARPPDRATASPRSPTASKTCSASNGQGRWFSRRTTARTIGRRHQRGHAQGSVRRRPGHRKNINGDRTPDELLRRYAAGSSASSRRTARTASSTASGTT